MRVCMRGCIIRYFPTVAELLRTLARVPVELPPARRRVRLSAPCATDRIQSRVAV
jgi:hypothetical protein